MEGHLAKDKMSSNRRGSRRPSWVVGLVATGLGICVAVAGLRAVQGCGPKGPKEGSLQDVRRIVLACHAYAADNDGAFPDSLEQLYPAYAGNLKRSAPPRDAAFSDDFRKDYVIVPGLNWDTPRTTILIYRRSVGSRKDPGRAVAFVDGHTDRVLGESPFRAMLQEQRRRLDESARASPAGTKATVADPINTLVHQLNASNGLWINGLFPDITLPLNAQPKEVIAQAVKMAGFDQGHIKTYQVQEIRQVRLIVGRTETYSAALLQSDLGTKILLFKPEPNNRWWTRFYDVPKQQRNKEPKATR